VSVQGRLKTVSEPREEKRRAEAGRRWLMGGRRYEG
jgi:hypothetical protein